MAQRDIGLVLTEGEPSSGQASGVWPLKVDADQSESLAFAVHDAKNMLGALQANVHWLRSNLESTPASPEEIAQAIEDMDTCCQRLANLLCQALLAGRGQKVQPNPSRVHLGALVGHAVHQVKKQAQARGVEVSASAKADVITMVDGLLVSRLLDNLLSNAVGFSQGGSAVVVEYGTENNDVFLAVSDQGPGIAEGVQDRLFEPFVTGPRSSARDDGLHLGLGLAFCRSVARAHGGDITYTNRASGGATFIVRLPWIRPTRLSMVPR
jgi:signal transduction histidine kinase